MFVNPFGKGIPEKEKVQEQIKGSNDSLKHLKLQFPKFVEGGGVRGWLEDCEQYFDIFTVPDKKKVVVAGMHLEGVAKRWYQVCSAGQIHWVWKEFSESFLNRFGVLEQELLYEKFKQLK